MTPEPKPKHLGPEYGSQFEDESIARAYSARPAYPAELGPFVASLIIGARRNVLELGAGTGDFTLELAPHVDAIEAVDPSAAMLRTAGERRCASNVTWIHAAAEDYDYSGPYAAVVAAESLHWMRWERVLPAIAASLRPGGYLIVVPGGRRMEGMPWEGELGALIARHSTNRDYRAYDLVRELESRGLFAELGRKHFVSHCAQSVSDYIESFHSRNGFSRERMPDAGAAFDEELRALVRRYAESGMVEGTVSTTVVWGAPASLN